MSGCKDCTPDKPCRWHSRRLDAKTPKPLKRTELKRSDKPINKRSAKRQKQENEYNKRVKKWKIENPSCMAQLKNCTGYTVDCHHQNGRAGDELMNEENWLPVCRNCHDFITEHSNVAIAKGLSLRRNTPTGGQ